MAPKFERDTLAVTDPVHFKALAHPLRHRLLFELGEPATISQLAKRLSTRKGNIAHHLKVLDEAEMVHIVQTRTVRGGTEQYYQRTAAKLDIASEAAESTAASLAAVAQEINAADGEPMLLLRHIRLMPERAAQLRTLLERAIEDLEPAAADDPRFGVVVSVYRQPESTDD